MRTRLLALSLLTAVSAASVARAQTPPSCDALGNDPMTGNPLPPPIYISGSTALEPMLKVLGPKIASLPVASGGHTIVYLKDGSCSGVNRLNGTGLITQNMLYIPASYVAATTPTPPSCTVPAGGIQGSLVLSDVDPTLCPNGAKPANVNDFHGPVNAMLFIVPSTSSQQGISAEMAYLIFGMGASGMVMPWLDPMYYFIRTPDSGTRAMISANVGINSHAWQGVATDPTTMKNFGSGDVVSHVAAQATMNPEKTIGILGEDFYDSGNNRASVKALAYRHFHQRYAYWPDSTLSSKDKRNIREGRYAIWGYVHMLAAVDNTGTATDPAAKFFTDLLTGKLDPTVLGFDPTDAIVDSHLTPVCAMKVTHDIEAGPLKPYSDPAPCGCYFVNRATGTAPAECTACTGAGQGNCAAGQMCRRGFCEAH